MTSEEYMTSDKDTMPVVKDTVPVVDETSIRDIDITGILPQRSPMLMIDRLIEWSENSATTEFEIREGNIFLTSERRQKCMTPEGIIENVAQTCAAKIGYYNKYILHLPVNIGYIGEIRGFSVTRFPDVGETLVTKVVVEQEVFGISLISAAVSCGGEVIATGRMKIAVKEQQ